MVCFHQQESRVVTEWDLSQKGNHAHIRSSIQKTQNIGSLAFLPWVLLGNQVLMLTAFIICNNLISFSFLQMGVVRYLGKLEKMT